MNTEALTPLFLMFLVREKEVRSCQEINRTLA